MSRFLYVNGVRLWFEWEDAMRVALVLALHTATKQQVTSVRLTDTWWLWVISPRGTTPPAWRPR